MNDRHLGMVKYSNHGIIKQHFDVARSASSTIRPMLQITPPSRLHPKQTVAEEYRQKTELRGSREGRVPGMLWRGRGIKIMTPCGGWRSDASYGGKKWWYSRKSMLAVVKIKHCFFSSFFFPFFFLFFPLYFFFFYAHWLFIRFTCFTVIAAHLAPQWSCPTGQRQILPKTMLRVENHAAPMQHDQTSWKWQRPKTDIQLPYIHAAYCGYHDPSYVTCDKNII